MVFFTFGDILPEFLFGDVDSEEALTVFVVGADVDSEEGEGGIFCCREILSRNIA